MYDTAAAVENGGLRSSLKLLFNAVHNDLFNCVPLRLGQASYLGCRYRFGTLVSSGTLRPDASSRHFKFA